APSAALYQPSLLQTIVSPGKKTQCFIGTTYPSEPVHEPSSARRRIRPKESPRRWLMLPYQGVFRATVMRLKVVWFSRGDESTSLADLAGVTTNSSPVNVRNTRSNDFIFGLNLAE